MKSGLTEQRGHIGLTIHMKIRELIVMMIRCALVECPVGIISTRIGLHRICQNRIENIAKILSTFRGFFYRFAIGSPSTMEKKRRTDSSSFGRINVDGMEKVGFER